jgi:hypothetical protein
MINSERAVEILEFQLNNIELAGHQLAIATRQCKHKLIGAETKVAAAILHINDAADIVNELIKKVEDEYDE